MEEFSNSEFPTCKTTSPSAGGSQHKKESGNNANVFRFHYFFCRWKPTEKRIRKQSKCLQVLLIFLILERVIAVFFLDICIYYIKALERFFFSISLQVFLPYILQGCMTGCMMNIQFALCQSFTVYPVCHLPSY